MNPKIQIEITNLRDYYSALALYKTQTGIAQQYGITPSMVSKHLQKLRSKERVERWRKINDSGNRSRPG